MHDHYLNRMSFMDQVIQLLNQKEDIDLNPRYQAAVHGFMFLCKLVNFSMKSESHLISKRPQVSDKCIVEKNEIRNLCNFKSAPIRNEVVFVFGEQKIACCRHRLSECSPLFEAMLQGKFAEANQSEIVIEDTTYKAFQFLVHFLYKCSEQCGVICHFHSCEVSLESVSDCLDIFSLANKYMVTDLQSFLLPVLSGRLLTAQSACHVFHFALLYDFPNLADNSVLSVTIRGSIQERMEGFYKLIAGQNREEFICTLRDLFRC